MTQTTNEDTLRALIRLLPPARRMREDLQVMTQTEAYEGIGDVILMSFQSLVASLAQISDRTFADNLAPRLPEGATDKQKVWQAFLGSGQLVAYLEAQTGLVASAPAGPRSGPMIHIGEMHLPGVTAVPSMDKIAGAISRAVEGEGE